MSRLYGTGRRRRGRSLFRSFSAFMGGGKTTRPSGTLSVIFRWETHTARKIHRDAIITDPREILRATRTNRLLDETRDNYEKGRLRDNSVYNAARDSEDITQFPCNHSPSTITSATTIVVPNTANIRPCYVSRAFVTRIKNARAGITYDVQRPGRIRTVVRKGGRRRVGLIT